MGEEEIKKKFFLKMDDGVASYFIRFGGNFFIR